MNYAKKKFFDMLSEHALNGQAIEQLSLTTGPAAVAVHDIVWEAARANLIGRELVQVIKTDKPTVLIPIGAVGSATWSTTEVFTDEDDQGESYTYATISPSYFNRSRQFFTKGFMEDATWDVIARQVGEIGRAIAQKETDQIIAAFAGGTPAGTILLSSTLTMADLIDLKAQVDTNDFKADKILMTPALFAELMKDEKFTSSLYYVKESPLTTGIHSVALGCDILVSSRCTATTVYVIDSKNCAALVLRGDLEVIDFEVPDTGALGVRGCQREDVGVVQSAFATGTR